MWQMRGEYCVFSRSIKGECEMTVNNSNPSMYDLAKMILNDACPPDNRMYLCKIGEDP